MSDDEDDLPFMQKLLDNSFVLLFLGVLIPTVTYLIWGIMELVSLPLAQ
jgi:hypothetical protein